MQKEAENSTETFECLYHTTQKVLCARGQSAAASRYRRLVADQTNASSTSYCLFQLRPGRDVLKRHAMPRLGSPFHQTTTQVISPKLILDYSLGDVSTQHSATFFSVHIFESLSFPVERGRLLADGLVHKISIPNFQKTKTLLKYGLV